MSVTTASIPSTRKLKYTVYIGETPFGIHGVSVRHLKEQLEQAQVHVSQHSLRYGTRDLRNGHDEVYLGGNIRLQNYKVPVE